MDDLDGLGDKVFVTDFDGTMTAVDFFDVVLNHADTSTMPDYWAEAVSGRLTHVEALNGIFQHAPRDPAVIQSYLAEAQLDPHTKPAMERLRSRGWDIVVVSAGSSWYIERILKDVRSLVRVIANPGDFTVEHGLTMTWPPANVPWYSRHFGIDKAAVVKHCERHRRTVAFAGDGPPDITAARAVPANLRFARGWLAKTLQNEGETFHPFEHWSEIADTLCS